ncbi:MAG: helix-turn-helix transcriptional regulator [Chloroflexota bacterium]|nr:helix-turn-helix transcriptional regulator [Chloroflexota bacterium]
MTIAEEQSYDPEVFAAYLHQLREAHNESMREASMAAGLDHSALYRFATEHQRPTRDSCIALADHFDLNPNEVLERAGYPPLRFFDRSLVDPQAQPPYVAELASRLSRIRPPARRRRICQSLLRVIELTMEASDDV